MNPRLLNSCFTAGELAPWKESSHKEDISHKEDRDTFNELEAQTKPRDAGPAPKSRSSGTARPTPPTSRTQDKHATLTQHGPGISDMPDYVTALAARQFSEKALAHITSLGFNANASVTRDTFIRFLMIF